MKIKLNNLVSSLLLLGALILVASSFKNGEGKPTKPVTDIDSNVYQTDSIGTQEWMTENLKTTHYNDGTPIPLVTTIENWIYLSSPGYCWYRSDISKKADYGALYNWAVVSTRKLCPLGWHVPSDDEWTTLVNYLGGEVKSGSKLKEAGTDHWAEPNEGANNESGFTARPNGDRSANGSYSGMGYYGTWWTSTENGSYNAWYRLMYSSSNTIYRNDEIKRSGFAVRCLRD
jgi:uncharacterized protein (TIGR02145 family)